jgi:predicted nucleic acid-binding protein
VQSTLVDAGIIIALLREADRDHQVAVSLLRDFRGTLLTTWPAISEACALMPMRHQAAVLHWLRVTRSEIVSVDDGLEFMQDYMTDYGDLPCDFADASLVYASVKTRVREIWTLDTDFLVYRLPDRSRFKVSPGGR